MKNILFLCFLCFATTVSAQTRLNSATPKLFIENKGQITDKNGLPQPDIHFVLKDRQVNVFLGPQGIHYLFSKTEYSSVKQDKDSVIISTYRMQMHLTGTNPMCQLIRGNKNDYYENYYNVIGRPEGIPHVPTFEKITYKNIYPNIDWELHIVNEKLKYNFIIHPGGDIKNISIEYLNASDARINSDGSLTVTNPLGEINESAPVSWLGKNKTPLQHKYKLVKKENRYKVEFTDTENGTAVYDATADITIDPIVQWRSYYGGLSNDVLYATRTDNDDNVLFAGGTNSTNNISTTNAWQGSRGGIANYDGMLIKMTASGNRMWATYYGGEWNDIIFCLAIDHENKIVIGGVTQSTVNIASTIAYQSTRPTGSSTQGFIAKLTTSGFREWGTYYGSDQTTIQYVTSLAIDRSGNIYLMGLTGIGNNQYVGAMPGYYAHNSNPNISTSPVVYIARFTPQGQRLWGAQYGKEVFFPTFSYATATTFTSITTDGDGNIYFCGSTKSTDSTSFCKNAFQNSKSGAAGFYDGFIAKFKPNGQWVWGTYLGGILHEYFYSIGLDNNANVYVGGRTTSTQMNFNGWSTSGPGVFARFDSSGSRIWTTHGWWGEVKSLDVDKRNTMFYSMQATQTQNGSYWGRFTPNAQLLIEPSTTQNFIVHGASVDGSGNAYFCGRTADTTINISGGHQNTHGGDAWDGFMMKLQYDTTFRLSRPKFTKTETCRGDSVWVKYNILTPLQTGNSLIAQLSDANGSFNSPITLTSVNYSGLPKQDSMRVAIPANLLPGFYRVRIINTNPADTSSPSNFIRIQQPVSGNISVLNGASTNLCQGNSLQLSGINLPGARYQWQRNGTATSFMDTLPILRVLTAGTYRVVTTTSGGCVTVSRDTVVSVYPNPISLIQSFTTTPCLKQNIFYFSDSSKVSSGNITSRKWIWSDSTVAFSSDTQRVFKNYGIYGVALSVTTDRGCKDSSYKSIEVFPSPEIKLHSSTPTEQCMKQHSFTFIDSTTIAIGNISRLWTFGDATSDTIKQQIKSYALSGTYQIKLLITSDKGCKDSAFSTVTIHPDPVANFTTNTIEQCLKQNVFNFQDSSSITAGQIAARYWTFGDGFTSTNVSVNKSYSFNGIFPVTLRITSDKGCKDSIARNVFVNPHPTARFNINDEEQCLINNEFIFTNQSFLPGGTIQKQKWFFDNGDSSAVLSPMYTYNNPGSFNVHLIAISNKGCADTMSKIVRINPNPVKPVISRTLFVLSSTVAHSYQWLLNNNSIAGAMDKDYTVTTNGHYQVLVTDTNSCSSRSDSVAVLNVGINKLLNENVHLYPNPNNGKFNIELPFLNLPARIEVLNTTGQTVYSAFIKDGKATTHEIEASVGIYIVRITTAHQTYLTKMWVK